MRSKGGAALFLAVTGTAVIFWYTTKFESDMRQRMKAGPERDRVVYEAKLKQREQEAAAAVRDAIAKSEEGRSNSN